MKAGFRPQEEAITTVMGVIVLIGVVIALATATALLVHRAKDATNIDQDRVELGMQIAPNDPTVQVVRASEDLDWARDLRVSGTCTPTLNGAPFPAVPGTPVQPTDTLACGWKESLQISSSEEYGNAMLFRHTF